MENYLPLFVLFVVAWFVPIVLSWLQISKLPAVIMEITIGVVIGPFVLNFISGNEVSLNFLSYTGFLFLIFLSGLALDIQKIISSFPKGKLQRKDLVSNTFLMALLIYLGCLLFSFFIVYLLPFFDGIDKMFLVILLPSVALSIIVPIIKSDGEIGRKFGQIILLEGAIATIMTILMIAIYAGILRHNGFKFELLLFLIIFVVFFIAYKIGRVLNQAPLFQRLLYKLEHAASQIRIRGSIAVLLLFVVIASSINMEPVLGAFFAGALLSLFLAKERSALLFKLDGMTYGFFIPIFFIMVGVKLDMNSLENFSSSLALIILLLMAFYFVQVVPASIMIKLFGWKRSLSAGLLLSSRLGLTIATAQIGLSQGMINPATNAAIVVTAILTCIFSPILYNYLNEKEDRYYTIYIVGGGSVGLELARRLGLHGIPYLVIESQTENWKILESVGVESIFANDLKEEVYRRLKIRPVDTVVVFTDSDTKNITISKMLKANLGHSKIITVTSKPELFLAHPELDDTPLLNIHQVIAASIENQIMRPDTAQGLSSSFGLYSVEEVLLSNQSCDRKLVKAIPFPLSGSLVVVKRANEIFIPHGDTQLLLGDLITVIGNAEALEEFRKLLTK